MTRTPTKSEATRRGLLAVLMLTVLVASVGIAWLLQRQATEKVRAGIKIIQEIRAKGLEHYWPEKLQIDWYLIYSKGETIGWRASARAKADDETFVGVDVEVVPKRHSSHERWTLNADATAGAYHADLRLAGSGGFKTDIVLSDGVVKVVQYVPGFGSIQAGADAPGNYLPEGTLYLAVRQAAEMQADAQFKMVFNERPNRDKIVEFGTIRLRYLGREQTQQGKTVHRVRMSETRGGGKGGTVFELDENGKILLIQGKDAQTTATDEQTVRKSFEDAPSYLQQILMQAFRSGGEG